jgi:hypothetical protein
MIDFVVSIPDIKDGSIKRLHAVLLIPVIGGPLVIIKLEGEHFAVKQMGYFDTPQDEHCEVLLEEIATHKVILKLHDVVDQKVHSSYLVIFHSVVYGCRVVETNAILLGYLVLEDYWVLSLEVLTVLLGQKLAHTLRVKGKD